MLKKIAILTAAAGMLSTSMAVLAEPTLYGRVTFGFKSISGETDADDSQRIDDELGSRLGVSGSNDLGNGMSVDYLLEYGAGESLGLRHANMTLNGSFGQFRLGKQTGVLYRYIGANTDQSWALGGAEWYAIAKNNMNSDHGLRMSNIAAYRFGAGPGGDDPITFDIQIQSVDMSKGKVSAMEGAYTGEDDHGNPVAALVKEDAAGFKAELVELGLSENIPDPAFGALKTDLTAQGETVRARVTNADDVAPAKNDGETIDSVTFAAATALGPVKLQVAYVDENGSAATGDRSPNLLSLGFRAPLGSAEVRGHMTSVDADMKDRDDNEAWGLLVMNDFGGGYSGMIGVGNYTDGGKGKMHENAVLGGRYATKTRTGETDTTIDDTDDGIDQTREAANILLIEGPGANADDPSVYYNAHTGAMVTVSNDDNANTAPSEGVVTVHSDDIEDRDYVAEKTGVHKNAGDMTNLYVSLTKSFGGGLSAIAEYSTTSKTVTAADGMDDDKETTNKFLLSLIQSF